MDKSNLIFRSAENTSLIRSGEGGASNVCVCRHSWATSPLTKIDYFLGWTKTSQKEIVLQTRCNIWEKNICCYQDHQSCYTSPLIWSGLYHTPLPVLRKPNFHQCLVPAPLLRHEEILISCTKKKMLNA